MFSDLLNQPSGHVGNNVSLDRQDVLLKVTGVNKSYGDKHILNDINLEVKDAKRPGFNQGQIVSLIGRSGCGKTTLFNIIAGLLDSDTGTVKINTTLNNVKLGEVGIVFQNYFIYPWRKVLKILELATAKNPEIPKHSRKDWIGGVVYQFDLQDHIDKYPNQLSGGQRQRVAIAEQILNGGNYILLDEPFSGLDTLMVDKVTEMLVKVSLTGELRTLVIVSHDLSSALAISDTAFVMGKCQDGQGATIIREIDLIERGLAWQKDIKDNPKFRELLKEVKSIL